MYTIYFPLKLININMCTHLESVYANTAPTLIDQIVIIRVIFSYKFGVYDMMTYPQFVEFVIAKSVQMQS